MMLTNKNGLAAMIRKHTDGAATVYLDGDTVSVHWYGATVPQIARLKVLVANYIDAHMMMASYARVRFFC